MIQSTQKPLAFLATARWRGSGPRGGRIRQGWHEIIEVPAEIDARQGAVRTRRLVETKMLDYIYGQVNSERFTDVRVKVTLLPEEEE